MDPPARVTAAAVALAAVLLTTGTLHFVFPGAFESIVPPFLGFPAFWVRLSGVGELVCAVGPAAAADPLVIWALYIARGRFARERAHR